LTKRGNKGGKSTVSFEDLAEKGKGRGKKRGFSLRRGKGWSEGPPFLT